MKERNYRLVIFIGDKDSVFIYIYEACLGQHNKKKALSNSELN
jgi:hypothetical protein